MNLVDLTEHEHLDQEEEEQIRYRKTDGEGGCEHNRGCAAEEGQSDRGDGGDAKRQQQGQYPRAVLHALFSAEFVADALHRSDVVIPDLFTHLAYVYVDCAGEHIYIGAPDIM